MGNQTENRRWDWFCDIKNLAILLVILMAIAAALVGLWRNQRGFFLSGFGALILIVILSYADAGRFRGAVSSQEGAPPLGLARGSVRAILAFGLLAGFGLYIYYATITNVFKEQIFTALSSIISAVVGFYFGSRSTAQLAVRPSPPTISGIDPPDGKAGTAGYETILTGTGFQAGATVSLALGTHRKPATTVHVVDNTQITCTFDLPSKEGKWNVVVANPDGQTGTLPKGFEIKPAKVDVPGDTPVHAKPTPEEESEGA